MDLHGQPRQQQGGRMAYLRSSFTVVTGLITQSTSQQDVRTTFAGHHLVHACLAGEYLVSVALQSLQGDDSANIRLLTKA